MNLYQRLQSGWAGWMQRRTARIPAKQRPYLLLLFLLVTGSCSVFLAVGNRPGMAAPQGLISPIRQPRLSGRQDTAAEQGPLLDDGYRRIRQFRRHMDSLAGTREGKRVYDSLLRTRPGLLDSVRLIELIYQLNTRK